MIAPLRTQMEQLQRLPLVIGSQTKAKRTRPQWQRPSYRTRSAMRSASTSAIALLGAVLAVALLAGCHSAPPTAASAPPQPSVAPAPPPTSPPPPRAAASQRPEPAAMPAGPVSNPGRVWCGDKWCRAHVETCCPSSEGTACVATPSLKDGFCPESDEGQASCDETADCPEGLECCAYEGSQGLSFYACSKAPCGRNEACLSADGCAPGFACRGAGDGEIGDCVYTKARVRCGTKTCSGDKPACFWDGQDGQCVKAGYQTAACTADADCGPGYRCCDALSFTYCAGACGAHAVPLCKTKRDCPPRALQPTACEKTPIPGMSRCRY